MEQQNIFNEDFLSKLNDLILTEDEIDSLYTYLALFEDTMKDEEKALWSIILATKDTSYDPKDEDYEDSDT